MASLEYFQKLALERGNDYALKAAVHDLSMAEQLLSAHFTHEVMVKNLSTFRAAARNAEAHMERALQELKSVI